MSKYEFEFAAKIQTFSTFSTFSTIISHWSLAAFLVHRTMTQPFTGADAKAALHRSTVGLVKESLRSLTMHPVCATLLGINGGEL